jgi:hypothetical protein
VKDLYEHLRTRLATVDGLRWIDFDLGQLEQEPMPPLSYPAALVAFDAPAYTQLGMGAQQATVVISLRCAFRVWERTHSKTALSFQEAGLAHMDMLADIHAALQGSSGAAFSPLVRVSMANEQRADLRVYTLQYTCEYYDSIESPYQPWPESIEEDENGDPVPLPEPGFCITPILEV